MCGAQGADSRRRRRWRPAVRLSYRHQKDARLRGDAFFASGETQPLGGGGLDRNTLNREAGYIAQCGAHRVGMRADLGLLTDKSDIHVTDPIAFFMGERDSMAQKYMALGSFPFGIRGREMSPDIAL